MDIKEEPEDDYELESNTDINFDSENESQSGISTDGHRLKQENVDAFRSNKRRLEDVIIKSEIHSEYDEEYTEQPPESECDNGQSNSGDMPNTQGWTAAIGGKNIGDTEFEIIGDPTDEGNLQDSGHVEIVNSESQQCKKMKKSTPEASLKERFLLLINEEMMTEICIQTNNHIAALETAVQPTSTIELHAFIAIMLASGRNSSEKLSLRDLWSAEIPFRHPFYSAVMSRDRFIQIFNCIRFDDKKTRRRRFKVSSCKTEAVRVVFEKFAEACRSNYAAIEGVTIDASLAMISQNDNGESADKRRVNLLCRKEKSPLIEDELKKHYSCVRATEKWPVRIFMEMLDTAVLISYLMWIENYPDWKKMNKMRRKSFIRELSLELAMPNVVRQRDGPFRHHNDKRDAFNVFLEYCGRNLSPEPESAFMYGSGICRFCPHGSLRRTRCACRVCRKPVCLNHRVENKIYLCSDCDKLEKEQTSNDTSVTAIEEEYKSDDEFEIVDEETDVENLQDPDKVEIAQEMVRLEPIEPLGQMKKSTDERSMKDFFLLLMNEEILTEICNATNCRIARLKTPTGPTSVNEFHAFIAVMLASGQYSLDRLSLSELWTAEVPFCQPFYPAAMSRDRFITIFSCIRFDDEKTSRLRSKLSTCKTESVRVVFDKFVEACRSNYVAIEGMTIDENSTANSQNDNGELARKRYINLDYDKKKYSHIDEESKKRYSCVRTTRNWPFRLFMEMLDAAALISYLMWIKQHPGWKITNRVRRKSFVRELCLELARPYMVRQRDGQFRHCKVKRSTINFVLDYCRQNLPPPPEPEEAPPSLLKPINKRVSKTCRFCSHSEIRRRTGCVCRGCQKAVCLEHRIESKIFMCSNCDKLKM